MAESAALMKEDPATYLHQTSVFNNTSAAAVNIKQQLMDTYETPPPEDPTAKIINSNGDCRNNSPIYRNASDECSSAAKSTDTSGAGSGSGASGGDSTDSVIMRISGFSNGAIATSGSGKKDARGGAATKQRRPGTTGATRGRPKRKALIPMYQSQISGDKNTIKLRIKKSDMLQPAAATSPAPKKTRRKRNKKLSDTDASDHETAGGKRGKGDKGAAAAGALEQTEEPAEQSVWGDSMPPEILLKIFKQLCQEEGCLPILVRLCRVCKLWRNVALNSSLWYNIDLNSWVKERSKTDPKLHWLIENRLKECQDLNLGEWKIKNISAALDSLSQFCRELKGLNLSGWDGLNADNLKFLTTKCSKLERIDLSSINTNTSTKNAMNAQPLVTLAQNMGSRLTHMVLAHNKLAGFTQIMAAIAANCPNLQLLDLSNIRVFAQNSALLHVEKVQAGCPKLRVLRITNSQILLAPATLSEQVASPGFPSLEELSLAGIDDDQITSRSIDDNGLERILKTSNKLRLLDVRGCIRITDSGLVRVPAWDLEHLFLSACYVTRLQHSGLELIVQKWSHSLVEVDLAWSTATTPLDAAVMALSEKGAESPLRALDLCGSSVSLEPVKAVLDKCPRLASINLQSCRALPRGIKRSYKGEQAVAELRASLQTKASPSQDSSGTGGEDGGESSNTPTHSADTPTNASE